ncbi:hypothetical protein Bcep18194_B2108 [Burkholderia lata]|uniref:Uncharacterized protein n=1 Tax=Burkholderia lata (strain ATCC 17760 / DSM 23089 / LMG 22485 / NCIMB 9086 / R18194 / 383) TaxID=482957 RepID=Q393Z7_BURL3|nr:hypothetical protein Bcep18194_B2108 [Burkholderia lata]
MTRSRVSFAACQLPRMVRFAIFRSIVAASVQRSTRRRARPRDETTGRHRGNRLLEVDQPLYDATPRLVRRASAPGCDLNRGFHV